MSKALELLILGDGNMSFSLSLQNLLKQNSPIALEYLGIESPVPYNITATTFDSQEELLEKYQESAQILSQIKSTRLHQINAWELSSHFPSTRFDIIVWNHPHLGTEDFRLHRFLLAHFFASVRDVLTPTGTVCISLVKGQHLRWDLVQQAQRSGLNPTHMSSFDEDNWPGYEVKRNKHGRSFKNTATKIQHASEMASLLFRFSTSPASPSILSILSLEKAAPTPTNASLRKSLQNATMPTPSTPAHNMCPHCTRVLTTERGLKNHIHTVHVLKKFGDDWRHGGPLIHCCPNCPKKFKSKSDAWQHTVNRHSTLDPSELPSITRSSPSKDSENRDSEYDYIPCSTCGQAVEKGKGGLELHLETLKPAVGMRMTCLVCSKGEFIESRALFQHYNFCRITYRKESCKQQDV